MILNCHALGGTRVFSQVGLFWNNDFTSNVMWLNEILCTVAEVKIKTMLGWLRGKPEFDTEVLAVYLCLLACFVTAWSFCL